MRTAQILLIEDNPADVLLIEMALKENGISNSLTRFESGADALEALSDVNSAASSLVPDAILLDLNTPRADGFDVLRRLRDTPRLVTVPIAILTSSRDRKDKHRAGIQGVRYLVKPSNLEEFLSSVGRAIKEMLGLGSL